MAISINWGTYVINIPKADTTLLQASPTEIRELNINNFRLALKDLEDDENGMVFPKTHNHNPSVSLSGIELARVVEILPPYTITFEDGQWAVNLAGANSNISDRTNVNQVSVRSANSAGLVQTREIEHASYNEGVTLDTVNGTDSTLYPYGTPQYPCKTVSNSYQIRLLRGFKRIYLKSDINLTGIPDGLLADLELIGVTGFRTHTVSGTNVLLTNCTSRNLKVTGSVKNGSSVILDNCEVNNLQNATVIANDCTIFGGTYKTTELHNCQIEGDIKVALNGKFSGVGVVFNGDLSNIDAQGLVNTISLDINSGYVLIKNLATGGLAEFNLRGGELELDSNITGGDFYVEGYGRLYGDPIALGMNVKANNLISLESIPASVWDESVEGIHNARESMRLITSVMAGKSTIIDNGNNNATVIFRDINDTVDRVTATMDGSERSVVNLNI